MENDKRKRNIMIVLFLLAFLFLFVGLERGGQLAGRFHAQNLQTQTSPNTAELYAKETFIPSCTRGFAEVITLMVRINGCQAPDLCSDTLRGRPLSNGATVSLGQCSRSQREQFLALCQQTLEASC